MPDDLAKQFSGSFGGFNMRVLAYELSPPWLQQRYGERFIGAFALQADVILEACAEALKHGLVGRFDDVPPDALPRHGFQRLITRYPSETDREYHEELTKAWTRWNVAGTTGSIQQELDRFGGLGAYQIAYVSGTALQVSESLRGLNRDGSASQPDSDYSWWTRGFVMVPSGTFRPDIEGDADDVQGGPFVEGLKATAEDVSLMKGAVKQWKPANERWEIFVQFDALDRDADVILALESGSNALLNEDWTPLKYSFVNMLVK